MKKNNLPELVEEGDIYNIPPKDLTQSDILIEVNKLGKSYD